MPIYEYVCSACRKRVEVFTRSVSAEPVHARCDRCGAADLRRTVSRFAFHRSESEMFGDMGKLLDADVDENDPEAMAHWARRMKERLGDDANPELDELISEGAGAMPAGADGGDDDFESSIDY